MTRKIFKSFTNHKNRAAFIFSLFIIIGVLAIVYNFIDYNKISQIANFEYWSIFLFAVYLLFTWKFHDKLKFRFFVLKFISTIVIFSMIIILLTLPIGNINISAKVYNGIGIFIFMIGWLIEMYLFWTSEREK